MALVLLLLSAMKAGRSLPDSADNHCAILPDAEQLVALRAAHSTAAAYPGWPIDTYWSSTKDQLDIYHYATSMGSGAVIRESNSTALLVKAAWIKRCL